MIVPNAELMAVELLKDSKSDQARVRARGLWEQLLDYDRASLSASQRRFLMRELQRLFPGEMNSALLAAEDLAAQYLENQDEISRRPGLRASLVPGIWQYVSSDGRMVALHRTETLRPRLNAAVSSTSIPKEVHVVFLEPGVDAGESLLTSGAGPEMEGWRLALAIQDVGLLDAASKEKITSYLWIGVLVVATMIVLAMLALGLVRRQMALTQLRNDLVANVTHELKTPLSSMRLFVETLLNAPRIHEQTAREYLQLIAQENLRLSRLIENFLTFSRIERNKYSFDFKRVPASDIAESAATAVCERFNVPGCRFVTRVSPGLPPVTADVDAMVMTLTNLLDNAYKYSGETKEIALTASATNGSVQFTVEDNGIGLAARDLKRVFKRFYQVNQNLSPSRGGAGLGLSIVQFVVTAHRGTVTVESEPERGSRFTITIPAAGSENHEETHQ